MRGRLSFAVLFGASVGGFTHNRMGWKDRPLNQVYSVRTGKDSALPRFRLPVSSPLTSVCPSAKVGQLDKVSGFPSPFPKKPIHIANEKQMRWPLLQQTQEGPSSTCLAVPGQLPTSPEAPYTSHLPRTEHSLLRAPP